MPNDTPAPSPKLALAPDWYVEAPRPPNFNEGRPGLYEWRIEGKGSYIGQYRWISRPRREYGLNVARLINDLPYRKGKPTGFRRIHRELAAALMEGRRIELVFLENGERPALNARETELIRERGDLNGPVQQVEAGMTNETYPDRLVIIRAELEQRARARKTITYGEMAPRVGLIPMALGRLLDALHDEEKAHGRPDLGCLVVNATTKFPGYVGDSESERANALAVREAVFKTWAKS